MGLFSAELRQRCASIVAKVAPDSLVCMQYIKLAQEASGGLLLASPTVQQVFDRCSRCCR